MRLESLVNQSYNSLNENDKIIIKQILIEISPVLRNLITVIFYY